MGNWKVDDLHGKIIYGDDIIIAQVYGRDAKDCEQKENLIAAAPDMLDALKDIENDDNSIPKPIWKKIQKAETCT